jgi:hypothetical protein
MMRLLIVALCAVALAGCAVGNTYDYQAADIGLPVVGKGKVGVAVVDRRPYVLSGDKEADFVGLQRGGFGNPFNVTTKSGKPLASDMQTSLAQAVQEKGFEVTELYFSSPDSAVVATAVRDNGAKRNVVLSLNEWKTDAMMNFAVSYDLVLQIVDENYEVIAESNTSGDKEKLGAAGMASQNSRTAAQVFEVKVSRMFNEPEVGLALEAD